MDNEKTNGQLKLAKKAGVIFGAALAAMSQSGTIEVAQITPIIDNNNNATVLEMSKPTRKPIPVLKLNIVNPELSVFVAQHGSHGSHGSHSSHSSHSSSSLV